MADEGHHAIGGDAEEHLGIVDPAVGHGVGAEQLLLARGKGTGHAPVGGDHQRAGGGQALEEAAAAEVDDDQVVLGEIVVRAHAWPSCSLLAALWMAVLIRL
ncbi:hypothetical protein D3C84_1109740 [compost metagenome]